MIDTVIFDMDGTLIDTERFYRVCWPKALAHFGYEMSDEQALSMRSLGRPFAPQHLKEMFGDEIDYYAVRDYRKILMEEMILERGIALKKGAVELLTYMKEHHITAAIATATDLERTERYLRQIGIRDYFDHLISATMVKEGKPSPDIYIYACEVLRKEPSACFAVEDSPNGVRSAVAAGCKTIMIPDQTEPDRELMRMLYARVDDLSMLISLLKNENGGENIR